MKIKKRNINGANETILSYDDSLEAKTSRYVLLKKILEDEPCATLIVDTNQRAGAQSSIEPVESCLEKAGIGHISIPVDANRLSFFGLTLKQKRRPGEEKLLVFEIAGKQLGEELFGVLENYDIAVGLGRQKPLGDICDKLRLNMADVLFNTEYFRDSIYDSIVCLSLRSTKDIEKPTGAAAK